MIFKTKTPKTVDGVMAVFNKTIEDLNAVANENAIRAKEAGDEASRLLDEADAARAECFRAEELASRLSSLFAI